MLNDISLFPKYCIDYGQKTWMELAKESSTKNPLDFKYNILYESPKAAMWMKQKFQFPKKKKRKKKRKRKLKIEKVFLPKASGIPACQFIKLSTFEKVLIQCPGPRSKSVPATAVMLWGFWWTESALSLFSFGWFTPRICIRPTVTWVQLHRKKFVKITTGNIKDMR